jgi:hypothetical protein
MPDDTPKPTWRDVYDDRGRSVHVGVAAVAAAASGFAYLLFDDAIYRVDRDGTYTKTALTGADLT